MIFTRNDQEIFENDKLAPYAIKSADSAGRKYPEANGDFRMAFQKDKERVIHSKAFRRLDQKTQVFMAGSGDHYRTRLTHTLEVAQIARDLARRLGVNEDLCEVIALAHDLGHPPFGHGGETALDEIMGEFGLSFEHNTQSRRIVEFLEEAYPNFPGLNLSLEVLEGLIKHQTAFDQNGTRFEKAAHLEAQIVNIADEIAYTNHDVDDGLRSGSLRIDELRTCSLWRKAEEAVLKNFGNLPENEIWRARIVSAMIGMMIENICLVSNGLLDLNKIGSVEEVRDFQGALVSFSEEMRNEIAQMRRLLFERFYMNPQILAFSNQGKIMLRKVFAYYLEMPANFPKNREFIKEEERIIAVKDYVAGMTDLFLRREYERLL